MIRRTKDYILENKMINNHSTVLVALSGGADSVCLLLLLNEIKRQCADELDFALEAVHVAVSYTHLTLPTKRSREQGGCEVCVRSLREAKHTVPCAFRGCTAICSKSWTRTGGGRQDIAL